jgi:DNA-binding winged helix-turn-helix (wHTH) protein/predicted negative regulator of RcsB-dependent stress response
MNIVRFGDFELDRNARELRLRGREVALQPRVFHLLAYLVSNRDRVIDKEELLSAIWPGVVVTDASLQRAISLVRSALRKGGLKESIRTYSRRGYRFCVDSACEDCAENAVSAGALARARDAFASSRWSEAVAEFEQADQQQPLRAADLERWGIAAQCAGKLIMAVAPLERAAAAYSGDRDAEATARVSIVLARVQLEMREIAVAKGCLHRAASLLEDLPTGLQHGHLAWMSARFCIFEGDMPAAIEHARRTIEIGKQLGDPDLEAIGRLYWGAALQASGETRRGIELQDEAAAAVVSGNVSPLIGGIVYCGLLSGCSNAGDVQRAAQWTDTFTRWCERSKMQLFHGSCLLHRAEVFAARGELTRAQSEIVNGDELLRATTPWAFGDAQRLLGDVHLARGEFEQAETAYRSAREHGWDPYPGYAMLLHYRGQSSAALRGLQRAAEATHWVAGERRGNYLAHVVTIAALCGELDCARSTLAELEGRPEAWSVGAVNAYVTRARGELALAEGDFGEATRRFRRAVEGLQRLDSHVEAAIVRLRLATCLSKTGEYDEAELELLAARKAFERAGARFYLEQCAAAQQALSGDSRPEGSGR